MPTASAPLALPAGRGSCPRSLGWFAVLLVAAAVLGNGRVADSPPPGLRGGRRCDRTNGSGLMTRPRCRTLRVLVDVALGLLLFELGHWLESLVAASQPVAHRIEPVGGRIEPSPSSSARSGWWSREHICDRRRGHFHGHLAAVVVQLTRELRAQGQVTERLKMLTGLNCAYALSESPSGCPGSVWSTRQG